MSVSAASPVSLRQLASFVASGAFGSHGVPKRMRVGRLPLPQRVTDLTPEDEPALADVNIYVDRLAELPLDSWLVPWRPDRCLPLLLPFLVLYRRLRSSIGDATISNPAADTGRSR